jgi:hypothetical protein
MQRSQPYQSYPPYPARLGEGEVIGEQSGVAATGRSIEIDTQVGPPGMIPLLSHLDSGVLIG